MYKTNEILDQVGNIALTIIQVVPKWNDIPNTSSKIASITHRTLFKPTTVCTVQLISSIFDSRVELCLSTQDSDCLHSVTVSLVICVVYICKCEFFYNDACMQDTRPRPQVRNEWVYSDRRNSVVIFTHHFGNSLFDLCWFGWQKQCSHDFIYAIGDTNLFLLSNNKKKSVLLCAIIMWIIFMLFFKLIIYYWRSLHPLMSACISAYL